MIATQPRRPAAASDFHRLVAFGLNIDCEWSLPGSRPGGAASPRSGPVASVRLVPPAQIDAEWAEPGERIFEPPYPDGKSRFTVDRSARHYRLWFDGFGRYLVATDGTAVGCENGTVSRQHRERFLFAQALPLAAVLQGLELLHASAVSAHDGVAAFVGASGAGKTTLASRLVLRGAGFVADDVLALEAGSDGPICHPGPPFMAIPSDDRGLIDTGDGLLGAAIGASDKLHASPPAVGEGMPLRTIFYMEPATRLGIVPVDGGDTRQLLASGFVPYLVTPARLDRHLEIAQLVTNHVRRYRLQIPRTRRFDHILEAVEAHLSGAAGR
jgi:hypothetical protein